MTKEELEDIFNRECTGTDAYGNHIVKATPSELINWMTEKVHLLRDKPGGPPFSNVFTGMHDKNGRPIHEGDHVKLYYKGEYAVCKVIYDIKHAAFFIKWPDGYINQYFMNGSNYEVVDRPNE